MSEIGKNATADTVAALTILGYLHQYDMQFRALIGGLRLVNDFRTLADGDQIACLKGSIVKISALRAVLNYDHIEEAFKPNERADSYRCSYEKIKEYSPDV